MTDEIPPLKRIFTPTGYPTYTYVDRNDAGVERSIRNAFDTDGTVVSISGPSKSGKSVLVKKIVGDEKLVQISGGSIENADALWDNVLARLGIDIELTVAR
jgi:Fe-S cluster assembly ATPase SufC